MVVLQSNRKARRSQPLHQTAHFLRRKQQNQELGRGGQACVTPRNQDGATPRQPNLRRQEFRRGRPISCQKNPTNRNC